MSGANTKSVLARFRDNNWENGRDFGQFGQVVEKPSDLILCLFGFMKAKHLEIRANIRSAFKMFWQRVASLVKFYTNPKKKLLSAERPRYEFSATGLRRICKQWFSQ